MNGSNYSERQHDKRSGKLSATDLRNKKRTQVGLGPAPCSRAIDNDTVSRR
jgi:hypothetical protein